jgi:hypothetical protein
MTSIKLKQRSKLTGKDNYGTWKISTEMALNKLKAWRVINEEAVLDYIERQYWLDKYSGFYLGLTNQYL